MTAPDVVPPTPTGRRRLPLAESRDAALDAARALLVEHGPQGVTLKAVAARIERTHATLLHHFGSAVGLQQALIARMAVEITSTIREAVLTDAPSANGPDHVRIVDLVFEAFGRGGAGALASWMILTGNRDALDPILHAIHALVDELAERRTKTGPPIGDQTLQLVLMALGDALLGAAMARALGLPEDRARGLALGVLRGS